MNFKHYPFPTFFSALLLFVFVNMANASENDVSPSIRPYIAKITQEFQQIPAERQEQLKKAAIFIRSKIQAGETAKLTFICTHNSRRSHLAQIWTQTAAAFYGISGVEAFSGGTEATAMNIRTVDALRRVGFSVTDSTGGDNPVYLVKYSDNKPEIRSFSKVYNAEGNPKDNYAALMTCSQADKNCPVVEGSTLRIPIHYEDPKVADKTPEEVARYDERTQQIGREMFFMMSQVKS
jgi:arsenate reductase